MAKSTCWLARLVGGTLLGLVAVSAHAQTISLESGTDQIWRGTQAGAYAGLWMDLGEVIDGDLRRDLIIGAPGSGTLPGTVYVLEGGAVRSGEFLLSAAHVIVDGGAAGDRFGHATAAGRILTLESGTAARDLVVGAPGAFGNRGAVYLFRGGFARGRYDTTHAVFRLVGAANDQIGTALATGDLNADGYREIIVGAPGTGRVYVIAGSPHLSGVRDISTAGADVSYTGAGIGGVLAAADVTGDNIYDVAVGHPDGNTVYLIRGGAPTSGPIAVQANAIFTGVDVGDRAGASLRVGDLDADGRRDLFIGAPNADGPQNSRDSAGEVYVLWGSPTLASMSLASADVTIYGSAAQLETGSGLTQGDINRDTPNDLVIIAAGASGGAADLLVYYGRDRSEIGTLVDGGRRVVDFAQAGQVDRRITGAPALGRIAAVAVFEVTGEGARDVVAGIPANQNSTGAVYLTLSSRMVLNPDALTISIREGSTGTASIAIENTSPIAITWAATPAVPWAAADPAAGSAVGSSPGTLNVVVSGGNMPVGTYSGRMDVRSTSRNLAMTLGLPLTLHILESRFMSMTAPAAGTSHRLPLTVQGWAIDTGVAVGTGVQAVDIYAIPAGGKAFLLGRAAYGQPRPDVGSTYGARFTNSGFEYQIRTLGSGTFRLEARAVSTGPSAPWTKPNGGVAVTVEGVPPDQDDFTGDDRMDLLWQHADGRIAGWIMNGPVFENGFNIRPSTVEAGWQLVATADFNGDTKPDLLWQHRDGRLAVWLMNGSTLLDGAMLDPSRVEDTNWRVAGAADLNGDGKGDIIWQHATEGTLAVWLMNGRRILDGQLLNPSRLADPAWIIAGTGDLNGDNKADIIFQHQTNGGLAVWYMNGARLTDGRMLPVTEPDTGWRIAALGDLNEDGRLDFVWQHRDGRLRAWLMNNAMLIQSVPLTPGQVDPQWRLAGPR